MKIFIDTNILISAALFPDSVPAQAFAKATSYPDCGIICEENINELIKTFYKKFPDKFAALESLLQRIMFSVEIVPVPYDENASEGRIRDVKDRPLLRAAIRFGADYFLTGDKDFLESGVQNPKIITASDFLKLE